MSTEAKIGMVAVVVIVFIIALITGAVRTDMGNRDECREAGGRTIYGGQCLDKDVFINP